MAGRVVSLISAIGFLVLIPLHQAQTEPVRLVHDGRGLNGEVKLAAGKSMTDGIMVLVHGTMAHHRMAIMQALQTLLAERSISSLAVTLSLGVANRKGTYDCIKPHRHNNAQVIAEIGAWVDWAAKNGAAKIGLLGHSRGATQIAHYAVQAGDSLPSAVKKIVLAAPSTFDPASAISDYRRRFDGDLAAILKRAEAMVAADRGGDLIPGIGFLNCKRTDAAAATVLDYYAADGRNDAPSLLAQIQRPVLVVVAGGDRIVTDLSARLASAPKPAQYAVGTIDGADHMFNGSYSVALADAAASFWAE
jgi:pimeloyl-ACP methyl ester carboxylesterase